MEADPHGPTFESSHAMCVSVIGKKKFAEDSKAISQLAWALHYCTHTIKSVHFVICYQAVHSATLKQKHN